jgi:hypothetical protein
MASLKAKEQNSCFLNVVQKSSFSENLSMSSPFSSFCFYIKRRVLVLIDMPKSNLEFCPIFVELFIFEIPKN